MKKLGHWIDVVWNWTVYSSANPGQVSTTLKYALGLVGTLFTVSLGFGNIVFPVQLWTTIADTTIQLVQQGLIFATSIGALVALLRKLYLTIRGEHANIQQG